MWLQSTPAAWDGDQKSRTVLTDTIPKLQEWMPAFNQLRTMYEGSLDVMISAFRETDEGGIEFSDDFLRTLVEAQISLHISIQARFLW
jgi:hypothetical protein